MLQFQSLWFFVFLLVSLLVYYALPKRQWLVLLAASVVFYCTWLPAGLLWVSYAVLVAYVCSYLMKWLPKRKGAFLAIAILLLLFPLFFFKYLVADSTLPLLVVPLGLSYYTFALIGYSIDVSRMKLEPVRNVLRLFLFASFFGTIMAGPIERANAFIGQFNERKRYLHSTAVRAFSFFLWGLFLKIVIADRAALGVTKVFANLGQYTGLPLLAVFVLNLLQIFADFAGYSFMAYGVATAFGLTITLNFRQPFLAPNVAEFWKHWHISLSQWFGDYVFTPLYLAVQRGMRVLRHPHMTFPSGVLHHIAFSLSIVIGFIALGLWHGLSASYAAYGFYFGIAVYLSHLFSATTRRLSDRSWSLWLLRALTFALVCVGMLFFRSPTPTLALGALRHSVDLSTLSFTAVDIGIGWFDLCVVLIGAALILAVQLLERRHDRHIVDIALAWPRTRRWAVGVTLCAALVILGLQQTKNFIYFKF